MNALITDVIGDTALIIAISWLVGHLASQCGQPNVVGQLLAGIALGPSLLGRLPGHLTARLFPPEVLDSLTVLSQVAIVLFMFSVGYELNRGALRQKRAAVLLVAGLAFLVPAGLGSGSALAFRSELPSLGERHTGQPFILFVGVAVSITALPVLAAIVRERGLAGTTAGVTATAAAGVMDVAAWLMLAVAVAGAGRQQSLNWPLTLLLVSCFVIVMIFAVRPVLQLWINRRGPLAPAQLPLALLLALASAWVTALAGIHPVFGGFLAGATMPWVDGAPDPEVLRPIEQLGGILLPLFFAVTGLSLNVGALNGPALGMLAVVCLIACAGKLGSAYAGARLGRLGPRDSATVAVLVNTRGLTELIALNVGLSSGIISQGVFTVFVLMALLTTAATSPLLALCRRQGPSPDPGFQAATASLPHV
jgi:Kef-type K+ transport system membrane component KefB